MQPDPDEPRRKNVRIRESDRAVLEIQPRLGAQPGRADEYLCRYAGDQRVRHSESHPGCEVGKDARKRDRAKPSPASEPQRPGRFERHLVPVAHSVDGLDQEHPDRSEHDQDDRALGGGAIEQQKERKKRDGWHRPEEFDCGPQRVPQRVAGSDRKPERNADDDGDREPDRELVHRVADDVPEMGRAQLVEERANDVECRRDVSGGEKARLRCKLQEADGDDDSERSEHDGGDPVRSGPTLLASTSAAGRLVRGGSWGVDRRHGQSLADRILCGRSIAAALAEYGFTARALRERDRVTTR